jgi:hypothetical protein
MIILHFQSFLEIYGFLISKTRWRITLNFKNRLNFNLLKRLFLMDLFHSKNLIKPNLLAKSFLLKKANLTYSFSYSAVNEFEKGIII